MKLKIVRSGYEQIIQDEVEKYRREHTVSNVTYSTEVIHNELVFVAFIEYVEQSKIELVEDLHLSHRAYWCLKRHDIKTIEELRRMISNGDIKRVRNLGPVSIEEIEEKLWQLDNEG